MLQKVDLPSYFPFLWISVCVLVTLFAIFQRNAIWGELKESSSGMINVETGLLVCIWCRGTALSWGIIIKSYGWWYPGCPIWTVPTAEILMTLTDVLHFECLSKLCPLRTGRDLVWFPNLHGKETLFIYGVKGNCWANEILYQTFIQLNKQTRFSL